MIKKIFIIGAVILLILYASVYGFGAAGNQHESGPELDSSLLNDGMEPLSADDGAPFYRSRVAYVAEDGLYCVNMNDGKKVLLVKGSGISTPVFSNDGEAIAFTQKGDMYAYDFQSSKARLLLEKADSYCPERNGGFYASSQRTGIVAVNPQTAESSGIVPAQEETSYIHLKLSPDLKYLAYDSVVSGIDKRDKGGTWLYDTVSKSMRMIVKAEKPDDDSLGIFSSVGNWSPDSGKLLIWMMSWSASLSADGVGMAVYDVAGEKLTELETGGLAYDENVSFADSDSFAMITGGGREMFKGKSISLFDLGIGWTAKTLETSGMIPATPYYSSDGKSLVFAASPDVKSDDDYKNQMSAISKRQIYRYTDGKLLPITKGSAYRSEAPVFLKNDKYIVFARVKDDGEKSIWIADNAGNYLKLLGRWKYSDPEDNRAADFYGRIDWSRMFDVFDDSLVMQK